MTRDEVEAKVREIVAQQQGGDVAVQHTPAKNLQEAFDVISLDVVSIQVAIEDAFGLKFATAPVDRGEMDAEWDACASIDDLVALVTKWSGR